MGICVGGMGELMELFEFGVNVDFLVEPAVVTSCLLLG